jgi:hypothetical protein
VWTKELYYNEWYKYQNDEREILNSTIFPDSLTPIEKFRDYDYTSHAITQLTTFIQEYQSNSDSKFMLSIGFKLPHLQSHIPYSYYEMYKNKTSFWARNRKELKFPLSAPDVAFRCCAEPYYTYMKDEGRVKSTERFETGSINMVITDRMSNELMWGYCGSVSFVDSQLGRVLDVLDKHDAWKSTVVVLTSDHGMHNGEKGIWYVFNLFDVLLL